MRMQGMGSCLKKAYRGEFAESEIGWRTMKVNIHKT